MWFGIFIFIFSYQLCFFLPTWNIRVWNVKNNANIHNPNNTNIHGFLLKTSILETLRSNKPRMFHHCHLCTYVNMCNKGFTRKAHLISSSYVSTMKPCLWITVKSLVTLYFQKNPSVLFFKFMLYISNKQKGEYWEVFL